MEKSIPNSSTSEESEREKYEILWGQIPEYRETSPADLLTQVFLHYFKAQIKPSHRVIDFGCGPGRSTNHLLQANLQVLLIDFADNCLDVEVFLKTVGPKPLCTFRQACLWRLPADMPISEWGICFDVMEHIPTEQVKAVLKGMSELVMNGMLMAIELTEDHFGETIGQKLHLTVQTSAWWKDVISQFFSIEQVLLDDGHKLLIALGIHTGSHTKSIPEAPKD